MERMACQIAIEKRSQILEKCGRSGESTNEQLKDSFQSIGVGIFLVDLGA